MVLAVAAAVYVSSHNQTLLQLKLPIPTLVRPVSVPGESAPTRASDTQQFEQIQLPDYFSNQSSVRIGSIRQPDDFNPVLEVDLEAGFSSGQTIDITGWTVRGRNGQFQIPQAQEVYSFSGSAGDILLQSGDTVRLYSGDAVKGNFRMNKCMGYLQEAVAFTPALPENCPVASRSEIDGFSSQCQDYITSLHTCEIPSSNPPVPLDDAACHDYLSKLNYAGCVDQHGKDWDFKSPEWWVWMGDRINIFDPVHDKVQLLDKSGKVMDEYVY